MSELGDLQKAFARTLANFLVWLQAQPGVTITLGDVQARDGHMANSCHYCRLAADVNLFIDGVYQTTTEAHRPYGEYWERMHPAARWGGHFPNPDGNHYSFAYQGRA